MRKKRIAPSLLSADFARIGEEIMAVEKAGADILHLDIMDGHFVPNITVGPLVVKAARSVTKMPLDVHLMIENPEKYIPEFAKAGADYIAFHIEECKDVRGTIKLIKNLGVKAAIAVNPPTPIDGVLNVLSELDMVVVMTVNPGFAGQKFIPDALDKVKVLRKMIDDKGLGVEIEVDGGIKVDNIKEVALAGCDIFVAGSAIYGSSDYSKTISILRREIEYKCRDPRG